MDSIIYTSYFAKIRSLPDNFVPISISIYPPKGWTGLEYKQLAPSASILSEWKQRGDCKRYIDRYFDEILSKLDPFQVAADLYQMAGDGKYPVLICYEKSEDFCHRHLVTSWLEENNIRAEEYFSQ